MKVPLLNSTLNQEVQEWTRKKTNIVNLLAGDRTGEDRTATAAYWKT
jgi:hypothetical protein